MSEKLKKKRESSTSLLPAKKSLRKTQSMQSAREPSLQPSGQEEVLSAPSNSPLTGLYKTREFQLDWANDVPFHVSSHLLHLRRFRGMSQISLAKAAGTSQSAIARIESGQENITLDTLQRIITPLRGRFHVSISPEELAICSPRPWWEYQAGMPDVNIVGVAWRPTANSIQMLVALEAKFGETRSLIPQGNTSYYP